MTTDSTVPSPTATAAVSRAYQASLELANAKGVHRNQTLKAMAGALEKAIDNILEANTLDLEASREMAVPDLILEWLKLTPERLQTAVQILHRLAELPDPIQEALSTPYQVEYCQTYCQRMPLGTIALIYEAFPELGVIAAGLCLKTANSLVLRGGSEAINSNTIIAQVLQRAIEESGLPPSSLELLPADPGASIRDLVKLDQYINLIIPYGRPSLVEQVVKQATAPVLKSAMGNCYLYWGLSGSLDLARWMIIDSHQSEPDPVNAIEKVLIHHDQSYTALVTLLNGLKEKGFELRGDPALVAEFPELIVANPSEWSQAYLRKVVTFKSVENLEFAIAWMNRYSSGHANCLVTESYHESRQFALLINSAAAFINNSPRFYRHPQRGSAIFLGMSNQKGFRRGLIGLESLTTTKHIIQGNR
ncbi:MAG: glutamate-5-semialdehyde dehydrogenase [Desertifilum sp. SIO1I2]|nr:glutamate-5-semialdehyde dehydrogenase [Desertifilum sp. SIO1I2]